VWKTPTHAFFIEISLFFDKRLPPFSAQLWPNRWVIKINVEIYCTNVTVCWARTINSARLDSYLCWLSHAEGLKNGSWVHLHGRRGWVQGNGPRAVLPLTLHQCSTYCKSSRVPTAQESGEWRRRPLATLQKQYKSSIVWQTLFPSHNILIRHKRENCMRKDWPAITVEHGLRYAMTTYWRQKHAWVLLVAGRTHATNCAVTKAGVQQALHRHSKLDSAVRYFAFSEVRWAYWLLSHMTQPKILFLESRFGKIWQWIVYFSGEDRKAPSAVTF